MCPEGVRRGPACLCPWGRVHSGGVRDSITIGELAARTGLSRKALRLYGDRGLLPPARVDPATGFRRYGPEQVERARRIALLRAVGMPLPEIAAVLAPGGEESVRRLDAYWRRQEAEQGARRALVAHARLVLAGGGPAPYEVSERNVPERKVLHTRRHVSAHELPGYLAEASETLFSRLRAVGACLSGPVFAVYHGLVSEDSDALVEVCAPTEAAVEPSGGIGVRLEAAHREAFVALTKPERGHPAMLPAHDALAAWLTSRGLSPSASVREVYHPNWATAGPGEHVADVARPVGGTA